MNRRTFIQTGAVGGAGLALSTACSPKSVSAEVAAITGFLNEVSPLLPQFAARITQIIKVANDFNQAYAAGQFKDAATIFANLSGFVDQLTTDIGVNVPPQVKVALAIVNAAVRAIAILLKAQSTQPAVAPMIAAGPSPVRQAILQKADPVVVDEIFRAAVKH